MHPIVRKMWKKKTTLKKWSAANGFKAGYVSHIIHGRRGTLEVGIADDIMIALRAGGFMEEKKEEAKA